MPQGNNKGSDGNSHLMTTLFSLLILISPHNTYLFSRLFKVKKKTLLPGPSDERETGEIE